MCFTGVALRNVLFPSSLFCTVSVRRGFSALGDSDVAQTLMSQETSFRGIRQLQKKKKKRGKTKYIMLRGTPTKLMRCLGLLLSSCLISQLPNHSVSLSKLPASPYSPGLA